MPLLPQHWGCKYMVHLTLLHSCWGPSSGPHIYLFILFFEVGSLSEPKACEKRHPRFPMASVHVHVNTHTHIHTHTERIKGVVLWTFFMGRQHYIMFSSILKPVSAFPAPALYVNVCNHMCGLFYMGSYMWDHIWGFLHVDGMCWIICVGYIYGFYVSDHMCGLCVCNHMCKIICMGSFHVSFPLEGQEQWGERGSISRASPMTSGLCSLRRSAWGDPSLWI